MDHFADNEVKRDCEEALTDMLPSLEDVSTALDEYHEYHGKKGRFDALGLRREGLVEVSPADFWTRRSSLGTPPANLRAAAPLGRQSMSGSARLKLDSIVGP